MIFFRNTLHSTLLFALVVSGFSSNTLAAPNITGITGTFAEGNSIEIRGTGFGTKNRAAPLVWDRVDNIAAYSNLQNGSVVPDGPGYVWGDNTFNAIRYSTTRQHRTPHINAHYHGVGDRVTMEFPEVLGGADPATIQGTTTGEIYISYYLKLDDDPARAGSNKVIRVWDDIGGNGTRISWTNMHLIWSGSAEASWVDWGGTVNEWNRLEMFVTANNNYLKTWTNGYLIHTPPSNFSKVANSYGLNVALVGWDHNIGVYPNMNVDISEIYVDDTRARVEVCDSPTWANCKNREVQIPTTWSDTAITVTVNQGLLSAGGNHYFYVIDPQGNVNTNGIAICQVCPMPPVMISAN